MTPTKPQPPRPLPSAHLLGGGTPRRAGCGGLAAVQEICSTIVQGKYR